MKWFFLLLLLPSLARAEMPAHPIELTLDGGFALPAGKSIQTAVSGAIKIPVNSNWQARLAEGDLTQSNQQIQGGVDFNLDDDWLTSFFFGGGIGWQQYGFETVGDSTTGYIFGYAEAGKRFPLSRSWNLNFDSEVQFEWGSKGRTDFRVLPLGLSIFF